MKKTWVIIKREYVVRVRTKAFLIGTIVSPLLLMALAILPGFLATRGGGDRHITVINQSGDPQLFNAIKNKIESRGGDPEGQDRSAASLGTRYILTEKPVPQGQSVEEVISQDFSRDGNKDSDKAYLILPPGVLDNARPEYRAKNTSDFGINSFRQSISAAIVERRLAKAGLDPGQINRYTDPVELERRKLGAEGEAEEGGGEGTFIVAFIMLFFIYMSVLFYGLFVMRGVIEEKQSRIVEVVISSVKPTQMMMGKLIGIGLVGLTQVGVWALSGALLSMFGASMLSSRGVSLPKIPLILFVYFVTFFVLGYFLYATLYAMVGAMVSSEEDAQQAQMPVTLLIVVPMMLFGMVMANPNGGTSIALSLIPFFAPTLMMMRIAVINPPVWQILLSMSIMVATILACTWLAAKIYRVGILMYGKRPSLAELGRWLRYS
ncbi:MAG TPA: ABC transporter permease [Blastocatellia bacterium]|jgi:ABC-2 type transport system permease protein|nr:ABC transporter permease [Blastocatellia bacterium]